MSKDSPKNFFYHQGIALLITLVILAILAVFMTEFSLETKIETRGIQNYQASFKSRNAVKSIFKAVLEGLEKQEEVNFFRKHIKRLLKFDDLSFDSSYLNPPNSIKLPKGIISDFPQVSFYTPIIRPLDHLYNLNRIQKPPYRAVNPETKKDVHLANRFVNILNKWNFKKDISARDINLKNYQLNITEILQIYASIFDWLDKDSLTYDSSIYGTIGAEKDFYLNKNPKIEIKNGFFDKLSEINLIKGVRDKNIPLNQWKKKFTTYPVGDKYDPLGNFSEIKPRINVNLATYEELIEFLEQFDQNTSYFINYSAKNYDDTYSLNFFEKRIEIARELTKKPRLKLKSGDIKNRLSNITPYYSKSLDYFIPSSFWYEILLKTEIDEVDAEIKAIVSVDRDVDNGRVSKIIIHRFLLQ